MAERGAVSQPPRTVARIVARVGTRAGALAAALFAAACSTVVPPAPVSQASGPKVTSPRVSDLDVVSGIPQDVARNRVALLVPLTGGNAGVGKSIANATQLALLDTRTQQVRITSYDTAGGAAAAANRAIAEGAQLILGPLLAEDVRAVSPIARRANVPLLSFSNDVSVAGNGTYVMGYAPAQAIGRVVSYARGKGVTTFGGLVPNALYGSRASTAFLRAVEQAGGKVVSLQTYDRAPAALGAAVQRMAKDAPFDAVLIADGAQQGAAAVPLLDDPALLARARTSRPPNKKTSLPSAKARALPPR